MHEPEPLRMQHHARRGDERLREPAGVDALAEDRMSRLRQMDADLVGPPGLQRHGDERARLARRRASELLDHLDVRDRSLRPLAADRVVPAAALLDGSTQPVAPVLDEVGDDLPVTRNAVDDREVAPLGGVGTERPCQGTLGGPRPGEDDETACLLVETVDHADVGRWAAPAASLLAPRERSADALIEGDLLAGPGADGERRAHAFRIVRDGGDPGRLVDDDDVRVHVYQRLPRELVPPGLPCREVQTDRRTTVHFLRDRDDELPVDLDLSALHELAGTSPRELVERANDRVDQGPIELGSNDTAAIFVAHDGLPLPAARPRRTKWQRPKRLRSSSLAFGRTSR